MLLCNQHVHFIITLVVLESLAHSPKSVMGDLCMILLTIRDLNPILSSFAWNYPITLNKLTPSSLILTPTSFRESLQNDYFLLLEKVFWNCHSRSKNTHFGNKFTMWMWSIETYMWGAELEEDVKQLRVFKMINHRKPTESWKSIILINNK